MEKMKNQRANQESEIDSNFFLDAVLKYQYLPHSYNEHRELPPCFTTEELSKDIISAIRSTSYSELNFKPIKTRFTKFDGSIRHLQIPHIVPYAKLALQMHENWEEISILSNDSHSGARIIENGDGRIFVMNYGDNTEKLKYSIGKDIILKLDINNFFPSINLQFFSDLLQIVGFNIKDLSDITGGLPVGLPVGPVISNVLAEVMLNKITQKIDELAGGKQLKFKRYIDDYIFYCSSKEDAKKVIKALNFELSKYELTLNNKKTQILESSDYDVEAWIDEIALSLPCKNDMPDKIVKYIKSCIAIQNRYKDASVLIYGIKQLQKVYAFQMIFDKIDYELLKVAYDYPHILPYIAKHLIDSNIQVDILEDTLIRAIDNALILRSSDIVCWSLYILLHTSSATISGETCEEIIKSEDPMSNLLLYKILNEKGNRKYEQSFLAMKDNWMLQYELYADCDHENTISSKTDVKWMNVLKNNGVSFVNLDRSYSE